jgi:hypothetical protein
MAGVKGMKRGLHVMKISRAEKRLRMREARAAAGLPMRSESEIRQRRENHRRHVLRQRAYVDSIKLDRGCADCGFNGHPAALDFDHLPGTIKVFNIATMVIRRNGLAAIMAEIAKCEVVCANCHRIRTANRRKQQA